MTEQPKLLPHKRPNQSRLEPYRSQLSELRRLNWPYQAITRWLVENHQIEVDWTTVRKFCRVRNIHKGAGEIGVVRKASPRNGAAKDDGEWAFKTEGPLDVTQRSSIPQCSHES